MPVLDSREVDELRFAVETMGDVALRQVLYGVIDVMAKSRSILAGAFQDIVEDGLKFNSRRLIREKGR